MKNADMPAYPVENTNDIPEDFKGLTKREFSAVMAMKGILASDTSLAIQKEPLANWAVEQADALLSRLEEDRT